VFSVEGLAAIRRIKLALRGPGRERGRGGVLVPANLVAADLVGVAERGLPKSTGRS
jgi:hypothetical protein